MIHGVWDRIRGKTPDSDCEDKSVEHHQADYNMIAALRDAKPVIQKVRQVFESQSPTTPTGNIVEDKIRGLDVSRMMEGDDRESTDP